MADLNRVILCGRLTQDPELNTVGDGLTVTDTRMAVNHRTSDGEDRPAFLDVTFWGRSAELVAEHCTKGRELLVEGRLQLDRWEDAEGNPRSRVKVVAERFQFVGPPRRTADEAAA